MLLHKFSAANSASRSEEITRITLTDDEWLVFLKNLSNSDATTESESTISNKEIEWIDTNRCVPLCSNENFVRRYGADTRLLSIVSENYGDVHLRLWFAENNIFISLNEVLKEVFPGLLPEEVLFNFWVWWNSMPIEPKEVGNRLVTKREEAFGVGHISAWIQSAIGGEEPKIAWKQYLYNLKPWMLAYELIVVWTNNKLINSNNGRILPAMDFSSKIAQMRKL